MRDPSRIDDILVLLKALWHRHPDQRLGQLLENYVFGHHLERMKGTVQDGCIFYLEDDEVLEKLREEWKQEQ